MLLLHGLFQLAHVILQSVKICLECRDLLFQLFLLLRVIFPERLARLRIRG